MNPHTIWVGIPIGNPLWLLFHTDLVGISFGNPLPTSQCLSLRDHAISMIQKMCVMRKSLFPRLGEPDATRAIVLVVIQSVMGLVVSTFMSSAEYSCQCCPSSEDSTCVCLTSLKRFRTPPRML
jgi:hypothetical protein